MELYDDWYTGTCEESGWYACIIWQKGGVLSITVYFSIYYPYLPGGPPKLTKRFLRFRPISRFQVHPLRGSTLPNWPLHIVGLGTLVKTNFVRGDRPLFGGDMGG